jgi:acyl carrier protein
MTASPLFDQIQSLFVEVFRIEPDVISLETEFGNFPQWDSMGHMDLMVALEDRFGVPINADTISQLTEVSAILSFIQEKQNA